MEYTLSGSCIVAFRIKASAGCQRELYLDHESQITNFRSRVSKLDWTHRCWVNVVVHLRVELNKLERSTDLDAYSKFGYCFGWQQMDTLHSSVFCWDLDFSVRLEWKSIIHWVSVFLGVCFNFWYVWGKNILQNWNDVCSCVRFICIVCFEWKQLHVVGWNVVRKRLRFLSSFWVKLSECPLPCDSDSISNFWLS